MSFQLRVHILRDQASQNHYRHPNDVSFSALSRPLPYKFTETLLQANKPETGTYRKMSQEHSESPQD